MKLSEMFEMLMDCANFDLTLTDKPEDFIVHINIH